VDKQNPNSEAAAFVRALQELAPAFGLVLDERLVHTLTGHYLLLLKWNQKIDLSSVVEPVQAARFHYLESLFATRFLPPLAQTAVDVGSGAGFPGFPIAVSRPNLAVVLIESQARKVAFLRTASRQLGVRSVSAFHGRFLDYKPREFDVAFCRAIDRFGDVLPDILRFGSAAQQILLFAGNQLADRCMAIAGSLWEASCHAIPLSKQRFLVSLSAARST